MLCDVPLFCSHRLLWLHYRNPYSATEESHKGDKQLLPVKDQWGDLLRCFMY